MPVKSEENEQLQPAAGPATLLLTRVSDGDSAAVAELLPLVYDQLRAIAGGQFRGQRANHTLQPTALVHEAYLKLVGSGSPWSSQAHFCAVAATAMRQILSNHARTKRASKRAGHLVDLSVSGIETPSGARVLDLVALDDALTKLAALNQRYARMVELRFFGGLTVEGIAELEDVSPRTVKKDWRSARAWLRRELGEGASA
ncbi:MAG: sigma-70 family RNA polymerase sigma factor [Planctomycetes bacterium]|nr:sigma-70 family RNA polymerase sigma factor [Planctomycetota bacterium]